MDNQAWFRQAGFGLMVHFGLYSLLGGEWDGRRMPHIGEWAQSYFRIPNWQYHRLTQAFSPVLFDAEQWVMLAKQAGMRYIVVTAKHHEGFALFHSKVSGFNSVDATPFGRDIIFELAEACAKHGMRLGLYYSQDLDWSDPDGGGYIIRNPVYTSTNCGDMSWTNDWDFPESFRKNFDNCFNYKILPQVDELLTHYGELLLIWFDTPLTILPEQSRSLFDLVKSRRPDCLVNSRIGNGLGDYVSLGDNEIPNGPSDLSADGGLYESPITLNDTWGYKYFDDNWKSARQVREIKNRLGRLGINTLLNVGPNSLGGIPAPAVDILREVGES